MRVTGCVSALTCAPLVQQPAVPLGRTPGATVSDRDGHGHARRWRGSPVEVTGHGVGSADAFLDDPGDLDYSRGVAHPGTYLVAGGHHRRWLGLSSVDAHLPASARRNGVRPGLGQPHRPQPSIHTGRLHGLILDCHRGSGAQVGPEEAQQHIEGGGGIGVTEHRAAPRLLHHASGRVVRIEQVGVRVADTRQERQRGGGAGSQETSPGCCCGR